MPIVSAWPLLDKVWTFHSWTVDGLSIQPTQERQAWLKLQRVETLGQGWVNQCGWALTQPPGHPFLTLCVNQGMTVYLPKGAGVQ